MTAGARRGTTMARRRRRRRSVVASLGWRSRAQRQESHDPKFLLITGASGAGKTTIRGRIAPEFADVLDAAELAALAGTPQWSLRWRHQAVETMVVRAVPSRRAGKHFLLCGDPVPPGEIVAAPSANQLDAIAVCLRDVSAEAQRERLSRRGDDPALLNRHVSFADWMRAHIADPAHRPDGMMGGGWDAMRWERWLSNGEGKTPWTSHIIDTNERTPEEVAALAAAWVRQTLAHAGSRAELRR